MQQEFLKDIVGLIAGPPAVGIVSPLYGKKNVNEFLIAKKLGINVNQTRNILYKLSDFGMVSFIRKKDKKNGGWYTYFWTLDAKKALENLLSHLDKELVELENMSSSRQTRRFYYCEICQQEFSEDSALANDFMCPECGEVMQLKDSSDDIRDAEKKIVLLRKKRGEVSAEVENLEKKEVAARDRRLKTEAKKKAQERADKRKLRAVEKSKLGKTKKKIVKKVAKKKIVKKSAKKSSKKITKKVSKKTTKKASKKSVGKKSKR